MNGSYEFGLVVMGDFYCDHLFLQIDTQLYVMGKAHVEGLIVDDMSDAGAAFSRPVFPTVATFKWGTSATCRIDNCFSSTKKRDSNHHVDIRCNLNLLIFWTIWTIATNF